MKLDKLNIILNIELRLKKKHKNLKFLLKNQNCTQSSVVKKKTTLNYKNQHLIFCISKFFKLSRERKIFCNPIQIEC